MVLSKVQFARWINEMSGWALLGAQRGSEVIVIAYVMLSETILQLFFIWQGKEGRGVRDQKLGCLVNEAVQMTSSLFSLSSKIIKAHLYVFLALFVWA